MTLNDTIRALRRERGMTQEQLANEVGVVVTHISHIETGNSVPSLKTLIDIINALDCSADELLCIEISFETFWSAREVRWSDSLVCFLCPC